MAVGRIVVMGYIFDAEGIRDRHLRYYVCRWATLTDFDIERTEKPYQGLELFIGRPSFWWRSRIFLGRRPAALRAAAFMVHTLERLRPELLEDKDLSELLAAEGAIRDDELDSKTADGTLLLRRAEFYLAGGRVDKAVEIARELVKARNNERAARLFLMRWHRSNLEFEEAEAYYNSIKTRWSEDLEADFEMAVCWSLNADVRFVQLARKILSRTDRYSPELDYDLIGQLLTDLKADEAEEVLDDLAARSMMQTEEAKADIEIEREEIALLRKDPRAFKAESDACAKAITKEVRRHLLWPAIGLAVGVVVCLGLVVYSNGRDGVWIAGGGVAIATLLFLNEKRKRRPIR